MSTQMPEAVIRRFAEHIWLVEGGDVRAYGISFPTRMVLVKLHDGSLWINSPVNVSRPTLEAIQQLGRARYLVAPTPLHVWRLEDGHVVFPDAELWSCPQIPRAERSLPISGVLADDPPDVWADELDQLLFRGNRLIEEVVFFHKADRTVIIADLIQNHVARTGRPLTNLLTRLGGVASPRGGVPLDARLSFTNRRLARASLEKLLAWPFDKLVIGHGTCIESDAKGFVERAFRWLKS